MSPLREAADALLALALASLVVLAIGASIVRLVWPPLPELIIEATPAQVRGCPPPPTYRPAPIPVQPSDARRIA